MPSAAGLSIVCKLMIKMTAKVEDKPHLALANNKLNRVNSPIKINVNIFKLI